MKNTVLLACLAVLGLSSCKKTFEGIVNSVNKINVANQFSKFTIAKGQQSADLKGYQKLEIEEMKFVVRFDSSAIYQTVNPGNQGDVNKLFGFSDNNSEHQNFSARFGWSWGKEGLMLHAYVYNAGVRVSKPLGVVAIGSDNECSIKVTATNYIFTLNGRAETLPRASVTAKGAGYKLYPYFGGDETAPHDISIWIKEFQ